MAEFSLRDIDGFDEMRRRMHQLPKSIRRKVLRKAMTGAAKVVVYAAVENVKRAGLERSGKLERSIAAAISTGRASDPFDMKARVGVRMKSNVDQQTGIVNIWLYGKSQSVRAGGAYYWRFHEFGTSGGRGSHPGVPAQRFMQYAFEKNYRQVVRIFFRHMQKAINEVGRK